MTYLQSQGDEQWCLIKYTVIENTFHTVAIPHSVLLLQTEAASKRSNSFLQTDRSSSPGNL